MKHKIPEICFRSWRAQEKLHKGGKSQVTAMEVDEKKPMCEQEVDPCFWTRSGYLVKRRKKGVGINNALIWGLQTNLA